MKNIFFLFFITPMLLIANHATDASVNSWRLATDGVHNAYKNIRSANSQDALSYLNKLRVSSGQTALMQNSILDVAAQNHSDYLVAHNTSGHFETAGTSGFTGVNPWDRSATAGYLSSISENVSTGQLSTDESIDGLYSAIYHRFGFQDFGIDEIGIGVNLSDTGAFTYNMGNKALNDLCAGDSFVGFGSYFTGVCSDKNFKIEKSKYENSQNAIKASNPKKVIFPYANQTDFVPVFFEESPDPLLDYSVSGNPISIKFNDYYVTAVTMTSFKLFNASGKEITNTRLLQNSTDPQSRLSTYEYALYPLERLDWNSRYRVKADYVVDGVEETLEWTFTTRDIGYDYYKITKTSADITIMPNKTYALYIVPNSPTDIINAYSSRGTFVPNANFIDSNTLSISGTGSIGATTTLTLDNGRTINVTIASTDSAISNNVTSTQTQTDATTTQVCTAVITPAISQDGSECIEYPTPCDVPDGWTTTQTCNNATIFYTNGWNLLSLPTETTLTDTKQFGSFNAIYKYANNQWSLNPSSINSGEGFWLNTSNNGSLKQYGTPYTAKLLNLTSGWHLLGTGNTISSLELSFVKASYVYRDNVWVQNPTKIKAGEGFWVFN